ncbi:MAG: YndJ family protein [Saprospiraceae bacterium]|nr:YndJ family protein [Saprospiraceae bacterium]
MKTSTLFGAFVWLLCLFYFYPFQLEAVQWVYLILIMAPLVWMPLCFSQYLVYHPFRSIYYLPVGIIFAGSFLLPKGLTAGLMVLPYFFWVAYFAFRQIVHFLKEWKWTPAHLLSTASVTILAVGILWALADRLDFQPMGFSPIIVLLTATHFHYLGFIVLLLAQYTIPYLNKTMSWVLTFSMLIGIPATATGITIGHFDGPGWIEKLGALTTIAGGFILAIAQIRVLFAERHTDMFRLMLGFSSLGLVFSMSVAVLYALRLQEQLPFLTIPWMYTFHGSVNAIIACGFGLMAWNLKRMYQKTDMMKS